MSNHSMQCDQNLIDHISTLMSSSEEDALSAIGAAMQRWPSDARLYLLRGAIFGHRASYPEARIDLSRAIALAPDLPIARFMLGYLEILAGDTTAALTIFMPLQVCEHESMRLFATAMVDLLEGRVAAAKEDLEAGLAASPDYPALEPYIQSVLRSIGQRGNSAASDFDTEFGAHHFLLTDYKHRLN